MGNLQKRLDAIKAGFAKQAPAEALEVMHRATDDLRASGILDGLPKPGAVIPDFALPDPDGRIVDSRALLAQGPLVLSVYRGFW